MASELIRLALDTMPAVTVTAQTLPEENASCSVLKKLRFHLVRTVEHPEDGLVWEWQLSGSTRALWRADLGVPRSSNDGDTREDDRGGKQGP